MKSPIVLIILMLAAGYVIAQKENNTWYFGKLAGLDFNSSPPVALQGFLDTNEGCASVSDQDGQLLFYTDGITVFDKNHQVMPNGTGLHGGWSSTQSALTVKQPGSQTRYFLFTTTETFNSRLSYSLVDMNLNGGNGDVVKEEKNIPLEPATGEKIAATYHSNGNDIWIVSHRSGNNEFVSFLLTADGLITPPVVSGTGTVHEDDQEIGPVRFSHDGSRIITTAISAFGTPGVFEIFDFNNCSGVIGNGVDLNEFLPETLEVYGIEFSPNNRFLYITCFDASFNNFIYQLDLETSDLTLLLQKVDSSPYGSLQLGPDNRIYIANWGLDSLSVIQFPDNAGLASQPEEFLIPLLKGTGSTFGLPNPVPIYRSQQINLVGPDTSLCIGESITINVSIPSGCDSIGYLWNNGSTASELMVNAEGNYWVEATCDCQSFRDTIQVSFIECGSPCDPQSPAVYGNPETNENGYSLVADNVNKIFYVGGIKDSLMTISKMKLDGNVLWSRSFDIVPGEEDHVASLIMDSDGMLVATGTTDGFPVGISTFAMRYDPDADQVLWAKEYSATPFAQNYDVVEKGPGGNFMMTGILIQSPGTYNELMEVDRLTGNIVEIYALNLNAGISEEILSETVYHDGHIYGIGRVASSPIDQRSVLIKMDADNGEIIWSKAGHLAPEQIASLRGTDLVIIHDHIYSLYHGQPGIIEISKIYVQKTNLDGDLIWIRQYELPAAQDVAYEIIQSGDGLVVLAERSSFPAELLLYKIDTTGEVIWHSGFRFPMGHTVAKFIHHKSSQLIQADSILVFTTGQILNIQDENLVLVRTDLEGRAKHPCIENFMTSIVTNIVKNSVFYDISLTVTSSTSSEIELSVVAMPDELKIREGCGTSDTLLNTIDTTVCQGQLVEGYDSSGVYTDIFVSSSGCDSTRILYLTVIPVKYSSIEKSICIGETYENYSQSGTYKDTLTGVSGCDSIRTLRLYVLSCDPIVHYDLEACSSYMHDGSNMDYSEFIPAYPNELNCADMTAGIVNRSPPQENKHSCTPGVNGSVAMCISSYSGCSYEAGHAASLVYEVEITPQADSIVRITSLSFFEKAPDTYSWIDGPSGPNNFPRLFALRILKNGIEIYREEDIETSGTWTLKSYDFIANDNFLADAPSLFRFELLPYCPVGNGAEVSAWDIDEIRVFGGCVPYIQPEPFITGNVYTKKGVAVPSVEMHLAKEAGFASYNTSLTDPGGRYMFDQLQLNHSYYLQGYKNDDVLNGVSTVDLLMIRQHLLGITPFTSLDQYIAADINHNGKISVLDLVELQKLLLGIHTSLPNNTSWRFGPVPQDMTGHDMSLFNEVSIIESLAHDTLVIDFLGIKIGDINGNVVPFHHDGQIETRTKEAFPFIVEDLILSRGDLFSIPVRLGGNVSISGLQLAFSLHNLELTGINSSSLLLSPEDYSFIDGVLRISITMDEKVQLKKDAILFEIVCRSTHKGVVSEKISLNKSALQPEIYLPDLEIRNVELTFENQPGTSRNHIELRIEPNPVHHEVNLHFALEEASNTVIRLFDAHGRLLHETEKYLPDGVQHEKIVLDKFSGYQGVIYCQVITNTFSVTEKFVKI